MTTPDNDKKGATLNRVKVKVVRDASTTISTDVFGYEVPILDRVHGQDMVTVGEEFASDVLRKDFDADAAYQVIRMKYGDVVNEVYPGARALEYAVDHPDDPVPVGRAVSKKK